MNNDNEEVEDNISKIESSVDLAETNDTQEELN